MDEQIVTDRLRRKLEEVNTAAQSQLSGVQDHINFTLQQAYFKCGYQCFDRSRKTEAIANCVEHCSVPVMKAQSLVENEMAQFQERLQRALLVCQDKHADAAAKLVDAVARQQVGDTEITKPVAVLESCVNQAIDDNVKALPFLVERLKTSLGMNDST